MPVLYAEAGKNPKINVYGGPVFIFLYLSGNNHMKNRIILLIALLIAGTSNLMANRENSNPERPLSSQPVAQDSLLRHVVIFKFKEATAPEKVQEIIQAFSDLQQKIPQIHGFEWGLNNSPENLNKGLTHCFLLTFKSEADREIYLPHADHKAFGTLAGPHIEDVLVVDYWTR